MLKISREWAMPSAWTFTIPPIRNNIIRKYVGNGKGWIDPFAGNNSPAEFKNDMNPARKAQYHMDAEEFCKMMASDDSKWLWYDGILFDPPYSTRQISEHYKVMSKILDPAKAYKVNSLDTSPVFYNRVKDAIYHKIKPGGFAISFGWNTVGFGKKRGFKIIEVLIVCHGAGHNDTLCTVEQKVNNVLLGQ